MKKENSYVIKKGAKFLNVKDFGWEWVEKLSDAAFHTYEEAEEGLDHYQSREDVTLKISPVLLMEV